MAKRRRKQSKNALDYIALPQLDLDPETKRSIFIIFILALGAISLLSLFDLAGPVIGAFLSKIIIFLFGWGKWIVPVIFIAIGFLMYHEDKYIIRGSSYLGIFLFIIALQSLLHSFVPMAQWEDMIEEGVGGGWVGLFLLSTFVKLLGFWASLLVIACLLLVSFMLVFNTTLTRLVGPSSWFAKILHPINFLFGAIFKRRRKEEKYEEEEEEVEEVVEEEIEDEPTEEEIKNTGFSQKKIQEVPEFMKTEKKVEEVILKKKIQKKNTVKIDLPLDLLNGAVGKATSGDIKNSLLIIQRTLENFGIPVEMGDVSVGPTVTQYTFKPAEGVKLSKITNLGNDLALSLAAHPIRIEAPIPGKSLVGVEVPNQTKAVVGLKEILSAQDFKDRKSDLMIALGKDVSGKSWLYDLTKMPHLLVAGATNSGKSVCLNAIIVSLLYQNNPDDLRFIMVDPKRVELPVYNGIPHLLTPVITDVSKTINALKWCLNEMDRRFEILSKAGKRNIASYNEDIDSNKKSNDEKMPYLVFVIDELADLMVAAAKDIEGAIIRLAQMSRAVGIHLILATQRPSVDVITGLIKANMPARIAFSVASGTDSRTILDSLGAEKLLGQGDMLFVTAELSKPKRLQGAYVSDKEIKKVVRYIKDNGGDTDYDDSVTERQKVRGVAGVGIDGGSDDDDELLSEAKEMVINSGKASASYLQRRLSVGYARAARLLDILEEMGVVGPSNGAKPREILISQEQYGNMISQGVSGVSLHNREEMEAPDQYLGEENDQEQTDPEEAEEDEEEIDESVDVVEEVEPESSEEDVEEIEDEEEIVETGDEEDSSEDNMDNGEASVSEDEDDDGKYFSK